MGRLAGRRAHLPGGPPPQGDRAHQLQGADRRGAARAASPGSNAGSNRGEHRRTSNQNNWPVRAWKPTRRTPADAGSGTVKPSPSAVAVRFCPGPPSILSPIHARTQLTTRVWRIGPPGHRRVPCAKRFLAERLELSLVAVDAHQVGQRLEREDLLAVERDPAATLGVVRAAVVCRLEFQATGSDSARNRSQSLTMALQRRQRPAITSTPRRRSVPPGRSGTA